MRRCRGSREMAAQTYKSAHGSVVRQRRVHGVGFHSDLHFLIDCKSLAPPQARAPWSARCGGYTSLRLLDRWLSDQWG